MTHAPNPTRRRFRPTPACLIYGLLVVEGLLWLSDRMYWPAWHKGYAVLIAVASVGVAMLVMLGWIVVSLVFRMRFQFSIRSLLVLFVAVALPCSWLAVEMKQQRAAVDVILALGGDVHYDWEENADGSLNPSVRPAGTEWLRNLLGDDFFANVGFVEIKGPKTVSADMPLAPNIRFGLGHSDKRPTIQDMTATLLKITDTDVRPLKSLTRLHSLFLENVEITDAALERVGEMTQLRHLGLDEADVRDRGLAHLRRLGRLQSLHLNRTGITDRGLVHLECMTELSSLHLAGTQITDAGLSDLQRLA